MKAKGATWPTASDCGRIGGAGMAPHSACLVVLTVACDLRAYRLEVDSLWGNEACSVFFFQQKW